MFAFTKKSTEGKHHGLLVRVKAWHSKGLNFEGSVSEPQNESAKNVETKALKYCRKPERQKYESATKL